MPLLLSQVERSQVRVETAGKRNAGLIHVLPLEVGCSVPYALQALKYTLANFELGDTVGPTLSTLSIQRHGKGGMFWTW